VLKWWWGWGLVGCGCECDWFYSGLQLGCGELGSGDGSYASPSKRLSTFEMLSFEFEDFG